MWKFGIPPWISSKDTDTSNESDIYCRRSHDDKYTWTSDDRHWRMYHHSDTWNYCILLQQSMVNNKAKQISHVKTLQYMLNMQCNANMDVCVFRVSVTKTNHFDYNILEYLDI